MPTPPSMTLPEVNTCSHARCLLAIPRGHHHGSLGSSRNPFSCSQGPLWEGGSRAGVFTRVSRQPQSQVGRFPDDRHPRGASPVSQTVPEASPAVPSALPTCADTSPHAVQPAR